MKGSLTIPVGLDHPCATFFLDESGSKGSAGQFMVVGGIKTRQPGHLIRAIEDVRDEHQFRDEFKFSGMNRRSVRMYLDVIDVMHDMDTHIKAFVVDRHRRDPFAGVPVWDAQAGLMAQLLIGSVNKNELAAVVMDELSSPKGVSIAELVRHKVHQRFDSLALVSCMPADSRSTIGLQLADLVVGAIAYDRKRRSAGAGADATNPKARVVQALCAAYRLPHLGDWRRGRASILTSKAPRGERQKVVTEATEGP